MKFAILVLLAASAAAAPRQSPPRPAMRIRVLNPAHIPASVLTAAEAFATHIFRSAGIDAEWVDCEDAARPCRPDARTTDIWLHLLRARPRNVERNVAGFALLVHECPLECGYAAVSYPAVLDLAGSLEADPPGVLGATIVHEIGHLLLGKNSHARDGVMSPRFTRRHLHEADRGSLFFTSEQAALLRSGVLERIALAGGIAVAQ